MCVLYWIYAVSLIHFNKLCSWTFFEPKLYKILALWLRQAVSPGAYSLGGRQKQMDFSTVTTVMGFCSVGTVSTARGFRDVSRRRWRLRCSRASQVSLVEKDGKGLGKEGTQKRHGIDGPILLGELSCFKWTGYKTSGVKGRRKTADSWSEVEFWGQRFCPVCGPW